MPERKLMADGNYRTDEERLKILLMNFDPEIIKLLNFIQKHKGFTTEIEAMEYAIELLGKRLKEDPETTKEELNKIAKEMKKFPPF